MSAYQICTKDAPMPKDASGRWEHVDAISTGECSESCCDYWRCPNCGLNFKTEVPQ